MIGLSMPNFWLGLLLIIVFSLNLGWFPSGGDQTLSSIVLPAITIGTGLMATLTRTTRSSMLDVLKQEYLRTARAKGIPEKIVITSHALRNALIGRKRSYRNSICLAGSRPPDRGLSEYEGYSAGYRQHYYDNNSP